MKYVIAAILPFFIMYLLHSFVEVSFDITDWSREVRMSYVTFAAFFSLISCIMAGTVEGYIGETK